MNRPGWLGAFKDFPGLAGLAGWETARGRRRENASYPLVVRHPIYLDASVWSPRLMLTGMALITGMPVRTS